jgi:hypothetical protein
MKYIEYKGSERKFRALTGGTLVPTVADRLFFILAYPKNNPLQEHHAACFDMEQDMCNRFIHALSHILEQSPEDAGVMPVDTLKKFVKTLKTLSE